MRVLVQLLSRHAARPPRGQAMVLSGVSMFLLALMMVLSFNVAHAIHEKIRLQQHSDAQAYSMAIVEARALNYFAVSNRALAASIVSSNNLHAYQSLASLTPNYMKAGQYNMYQVAGWEFLRCGCKKCFMHCVHAFQALGKANKFSKAANKWGNRAKQLDTRMRQAHGTLQTMMNTIHGQQKVVMAQTIMALQNGKSYSLDKLKSTNAPRAGDLNTAVAMLNVNAFNCAIDGMICVGGPANRSTQALSKEMTSVANASRNDWAANRNGGGVLPVTKLWPTFFTELMFQIQGNGMSIPFPGYKGTARTLNGGKGNPHGGNGDEGRSISADDHGTVLFTFWKHGFGIWKAADAYVFSDRNGGGHSPGSAHSGQHNFQGVNANSMMSCIMTGNCFMSFRPDTSPGNDFNQPKVYSYISMPMRLGNPDKAPWELSSDATIKSELGGQATLRLAAADGAAASKAMVYFHRLGNWQAPPNMFDPYWRAKLHPFKQTELLKVLALTGNTDAAQLAASVPTLPY